MSINISNNMSVILHDYMKSSKSMSNSVNFDGKLQEAKQTQIKSGVQINTKTESVVDEYKRKHPKDTYNVDRQVNAGKTVLLKNGADKISRDDMTMEEYKSFITDLMNSIPFNVSQKNSTEIWSISEKGWERMKNDLDYEAWVLGYTSQNRAVRFPAVFGRVSNFYTENFGESIEEHIRQSFSQGRLANNTSKNSDDKESWWEMRNNIYKETLEKCSCVVK